MRAWFCRAYGGPDVLRVESRPRPVPREREVLVRIHATTVSSGDSRIRALRLPRGFGALGRLIFGFRRPRQPILGTEFSGTVAAVGRQVTAWRTGDRVIGFPGTGMGSHAEFRIMPANGRLVAKPPQITDEEGAALCFGSTTALHFLRKAVVRPGERVLVIGAVGTVGSAMVQLGRHFGARVTALTSTANTELARSLGAEEVIDYQRQDFLRLGKYFDVIADTVGAADCNQCRAVMNEHGRYLAIAADLAGMLARPVGTRRTIAGAAPERREDVNHLAGLCTQAVLRPLIDSVFPFENLPAAHARVDTGRKRGAVVVRVVQAAPQNAGGSAA